MANFDPKRDINVNQSGDGSGWAVAIIIAAMVLLVGGYVFYENYGQSAPEGPQVTQNITVLPAPVIEPPTTTAPAAPEPATPPAAQKITPPADAPATNP